MVKNILIYLFITTFLSCNDFTDESKVVLSEIESKLGLNNNNNNNNIERLRKINHKLELIKNKSKYAFCAFQSDSIYLGSEYRANFVLAQASEMDGSFLVRSYRGTVDTIPFNNKLSVFEVNITGNQKGKQSYKGFIVDESDSSKYPFEMEFFVK